ncbi:hypothetical protein CMUST_14040 [Corynebacterium mustelae]|uniref:Uncharacterized protein n=1 Tax=Corynebacterium mustelae TaxID=571915 RepID=A0A0G3H114_9CORY|nr:hypothetical protein [Corynebacterium mustelae]AKK07101.1 hypothetical protein CMUST_14040 [Corynebacterium mustelae]
MKARLDIDSLIIEPTVQPVFKPPFDPAAAVARGGLYAPTAAAVGAPLASIKPAAAVSAAPQQIQPEQSAAEPQLAELSEAQEPVLAELPPEQQMAADYNISAYDTDLPLEDISPEVNAEPQHEQQLHYQGDSDAAVIENYEGQQYGTDNQPVAYENYGYDAVTPTELADVIPISEDVAEEPVPQQTAEYYQPQPENPVVDAQPPAPEFHVADYPDMRGFHGSYSQPELEEVTEPQYVADPYPQPVDSSEVEAQPELTYDATYSAEEIEPSYDTVVTVTQQPEVVAQPQREILAEPQGGSVFVPHPDAVAEQYVIVETPIETQEPTVVAEPVGVVETVDHVQPPGAVVNPAETDITVAPVTDTWPASEPDFNVADAVPTEVADVEPAPPAVADLVQPPVEPAAEPVAGATADPVMESASPGGVIATGAVAITGVAAAVSATQGKPSSALVEAAPQPEATPVPVAEAAPQPEANTPAVTDALTATEPQTELQSEPNYEAQPQLQDETQNEVAVAVVVPPATQLETSTLIPMPTTREAERLRMQLATQALCFENSVPRTKPLTLNIMIVSATVAVILLAVLIATAKIMQMI